MNATHTIIRSNDSQRCTVVFKFSKTEADVAMQQLPSGRWMVENVTFYALNGAKTQEPGWLIEITRRDAIAVLS